MSQCWSTSKDLDQLYVDTGWSLEGLPGVLDDRDRWGEREIERESGNSMLSVCLDDNNDHEISLKI